MHFSADKVIESLYRAALNRPPDKEGMDIFLDRLTRDRSALSSIAQDFFDSEEHLAIAGGSPGIFDHSQYGEFPLLLRHLVKNGSKNQIIVDVGARGKERSNSFDLLSQFGWRGLLIEANPSLYSKITSEFEGTDFTLVECGVGVTEGVLPFYIGSNDDVSSLLKDAALCWGELRGRIDVEVKKLARVLSELKVPYLFDVLSLDIEGVDVPVLNDLIDNSSYRPKYIIIEASYDFNTKKLTDINCSKDVQSLYEIVDQTRANLILRLRD